MPRFVVLLVLAALLAGITACAVHIPVPVSGPLPEEGPADMPQPPETARPLEAPAPLPQGFRVKPFSAGEATLYGFRSFLAAAKQALGHDPGEVARLADAARSYYDAIGFPPGHVYLESLQAKAFFDTGHPEQALQIGRRATKRAQELNLPDFVWRVEALMGEGLLRAGRKSEAERALRDAQIAVDRIVGALGSDRDKRRFGVNKENITVYLTSLDFERRDAKTLFQGLERGRARAFVDMLAAVDLSKTHRHLDELREVSRLARQKSSRPNWGRRRTREPPLETNSRI